MIRHLARLAALGMIPLVLLVTIYNFASPPFTIALQPIVTSGLDKPVYLTFAADGSGRLFVVELEGRIRVIKNGVLLDEPYLDIHAEVKCCSEQGLFSVAFDPEYETNGTFYLNYIDNEGDTEVARYVVPMPSSDIANPLSTSTVLTIHQPFFNHNGGQLQFNPIDGYLYIGMGDGGGSGDPDNRGQSLDTLLGKILRIDVQGVPTYTIPATNPFIRSAGIQHEIWAYGLRNPWRFSFDRATGDLYIGDVGQDCYEEIDYEPANGPGGRNYGWSWMEGFHEFYREKASDCNQPKITRQGLTVPVAEYGHPLGIAVTGGYVYRGKEYPWLNGVYFYSDFGSGRIWALKRGEQGSWVSDQLLNTQHTIVSFGEDEIGELYVVDIGEGVISKLVSSASSQWPPDHH